MMRFNFFLYPGSLSQMAEKCSPWSEYAGQCRARETTRQTWKDDYCHRFFCGDADCQFSWRRSNANYKNEVVAKGSSGTQPESNGKMTHSNVTQ
jgi:hypothetical protein